MGDETPRAITRLVREFTLTLHVLEHSRFKRTLYTASVVDEKRACAGERAICHVQPIPGVMLAIAHELGLQDAPPCLPLSEPAELEPLVQRLRSMNQDDGHTAAERIELLWWGLQHVIGERKRLEARLDKLGCLLEQMAGKTSVDKDDASEAVLPAESMLQLLASARDPRDGCRVYQELQLLRELAAVTADTVATINNWLGHAGTREGAMDALWRVARLLQSLGWELPNDNLRWRGQLVRAMEEAGIGLGEDNVIRVRLPEDRAWQPASGASVKTILESLTQRASAPASP